MHVLWGLGGMCGLLLIAFALSSNRKAIRLRTVGPALALQVGFGALVLFVPWGRDALSWVSNGFQAIIDSAKAGIGFLFGPLIPEEGLIFALQVLPVIVFFASLTAVLYHLGFLQKFVQFFGGGLQRLLGTGKAESTNAAANVFLGQTEAPLIIRPYITRLSQSGLFAVMVGGLSTVAGSVLVGYSLLGARLDYLIAAAFMAAPGALLMAKIIMPEDPEVVAAQQAGIDELTSRTGRPEARTAVATHGMAAPVGQGYEIHGRGDRHDHGKDQPLPDDTGELEALTAESDDDDVLGEVRHRNVIDAAASGAADGAKLAINIGAMLLAFISLIALLNLIIGGIGGWFGQPDITFEQILGYVFSPVMVMIGVPLNEAVEAGSYIGQKIVVNEFVAFSNFGPEAASFSPRTQAIITFGLTGFANLGSLGILLGGLGGLAPKRRGDIATLGMKAIAAATLANLMSAAIAGIMLGGG